MILPNVDDVDDVHWRKRENKLVKTEYEDENDNVYESEEDRLKKNQRAWNGVWMIKNNKTVKDNHF